MATGNIPKIVLAPRVFPCLVKFANATGYAWLDEAGFHVFPGSISAALIDADVAEIDQGSLPPARELAQKQNMMQYYSVWGADIRQVPSAGILDSPGRCETDPNVAGERLAQHLEPVHAPVAVDEAAVERIKPFSQPAPRVVFWTLEQPGFEEMLRRLHDTGAGPDGL
eukprot:2875807-Pyramimonas_sp.AAC.1